MKFFKTQWAKSLFNYTAFGVAIGVGFLIYNNDQFAPVLNNFEVGEASLNSDTGQIEFAFSGEITDSRGITAAEIHCIENEQTKFFIYLELYGSSKYFVSFGEKSGSFSWMGGWDGTATDLSFQGNARLIAPESPINCQWQSRLKDAVGNYKEADLAITTLIAGK